MWYSKIERLDKVMTTLEAFIGSYQMAAASGTSAYFQGPLAESASPSIPNLRKQVGIMDFIY